MLWHRGTQAPSLRPQVHSPRPTQAAMPVRPPGFTQLQVDLTGRLGRPGRPLCSLATPGCQTSESVAAAAVLAVAEPARKRLQRQVSAEHSSSMQMSVGHGPDGGGPACGQARKLPCCGHGLQVSDLLAVARRCGQPGPARLRVTHHGPSPSPCLRGSAGPLSRNRKPEARPWLHRPRPWLQPGPGGFN